MGGDEQITVRMVVTRVPELLPVVQGFVDRLAQQLQFAEPQRLNLKQGVGQACSRIMEVSGGETGEEIRLEFSGYPDRLEIVLESDDGLGEGAETQAFLLNQMLDRVSVEDTAAGGHRITLVKFNQRGSQP